MTFREANIYDISDDHITKYNKIIDFLGYQNVKSILQHYFSREEISNAFKKDEHLNSMPVKKWDTAAGFVLRNTANGHYYSTTSNSATLVHLCASKGINCSSVSDCVCILKRCAILWINEPDAANGG